MLQDSLVILDFETTGLRPERGDRITEVALARIERGRITHRYESLVNCGVRIPPFISEYTGIIQQMVDEAPPVEQVMREVAAFIGETTVAAHSARFDQRFFLKECRRLRIGMVVEPFLCTMRLSRRLYPNLKSHSLGVLAHALQLKSSGAPHRAGPDAELTAELMLRLARDIGEMQEGLVTTRVLRRLMHTPVAQVQSQMQSVSGQSRLCA